MAQQREWNNKAKLNSFLNDIVRVGSVKGFKYFRMYMRGREELVCWVMNTPKSITPMMSPTSSFNLGESIRLPRNAESLLLSSRTQKRLSGFGYMDVGLPPASPSNTEILQPDDESTIFLVAGYARYACPYVWVRSNHERLTKPGQSASRSSLKDSPLKLKSTEQWVNYSIRLWDILDELVRMNTSPTPPNPFSIDLNYFKSLEGLEAVLSSAAMIHFLQRVLDSGSHTYDASVVEDLANLTLVHFTAVYALRDSTGPYAPPPTATAGRVAAPNTTGRKEDESEDDV